MKTKKVRFCGAKHERQICLRPPGHTGAHVGIVAAWGDPKEPARRRTRRTPGQGRLPLC